MLSRKHDKRLDLDDAKIRCTIEAQYPLTSVSRRAVKVGDGSRTPNMWSSDRRSEHGPDNLVVAGDHGRCLSSKRCGLDLWSQEHKSSECDYHD